MYSLALVVERRYEARFTCASENQVAIKKLHAKQFEEKVLEEFRKEVAIMTYCESSRLFSLIIAATFVIPTSYFSWGPVLCQDTSLS